VSVLVALLAAACAEGASDEATESAVTTSTSVASASAVSTTSTIADTTTTSSTVPPDAALLLALSAEELVAAVPEGITCAMTGEDTVVLRIRLDASTGRRPATGSSTTGSTTTAVSERDLPGIEQLDVRTRSSNGRTGVIEVEPATDGTWEATIGPFPARRDMDDQDLEVEVRAELADGRLVEETVAVVLRAPQGCVDTQGDRVRYARDEVTLDVATSPAPLELWATGDVACPSGPTTAQVTARVSAPVDRVGARLVLGGTGVASVALIRQADGTWTGTIGPVAGRATMDERTPLRLEVLASTGGRSISAGVDGILVRPGPCPTATTSTTSPGTDGGPVTLTIATSPSPLELWATLSGACPSGPTTVRVTARASRPVDRVGARLLVGGTAVATFDLARQADGSWAATSPTVAGRPSMDARTPIRLELLAAAGGRSASASVDGVLVRPDRCAPVTTAPPAPTTTTAPSTTTTVPPAPTVSVSTTGSVYAVISGACPSGSTTLGVGIQVPAGVSLVSITGTVTNAIGQSSGLAFSSAGGGRYTASAGPFTGTPQMPVSSALTVQVTVTDAQGRTASGSGSATLLRPDPCPTTTTIQP
jgi:hypothetical protein